MRPAKLDYRNWEYHAGTLWICDSGGDTPTFGGHERPGWRVMSEKIFHPGLQVLRTALFFCLLAATAFVAWSYLPGANFEISRRDLLRIDSLGFTTLGLIFLIAHETTTWWVHAALKADAQRRKESWQILFNHNAQPAAQLQEADSPPPTWLIHERFLKAG